MATERELNKRIKSVKNISQVTSALAAVSASKASKAQRQVEATRDYAGKAFEILNNLASQPGMSEAGHPLLNPRHSIDRTGLLLITSDRGLAGAYNTNIIRRTERFIKVLGEGVDIITVGRKGRDLLIRRGHNVVASFNNFSRSPSFLESRAISRVIIEDYLKGNYDQVFVAYTDYINLVTQKAVVRQLLPLRPLEFDNMAVAEYVSTVDLEGVSERVYSYEPEPASLLNTIVPRFTELQVYQAVLEALASEHSSRMMAMNSATDNAAELIDLLILERNKARQASITSEILDIVGGAEALAKGN